MHMINTLMEITIYSAVIFGMLILLKRCLGKRMSPGLHYALWFVLVARLMLPVTMDTGFHLITLPDNAPAISAPAAAPQSQSIPPTENIDVAMPFVPSMQGGGDLSHTPAQPTPTEPETARLSIQQIALRLWGAGMVAVSIWLAVLYAVLLGRIRRHGAKPAKKLVALLEEVKSELGVRGKIKLICLYEYGTPALLFPNTILMPIDALAAMDAGQVKLALRHELTHYKRGDPLMGLLLSVLNAIYWFNPIVWVAFPMMRADMETACDAMVTRRLAKAEKNEYACLILNLFAQPKHRQIVLGMAQSSTRKLAEQRIRGVFMATSSKPVAKIVSAAMVLMLLAGCFTTACVPVEKDAAAVGAAGNSGGTTALDASGNLDERDPVQLFAQETFYDGKLSLFIDGEAAFPPVASFPIYSMADAPFSLQQVNAMTRVLMQGQVAEVTADAYSPGRQFEAYADLGQAKMARLSIPNIALRGTTNCMYFENGIEYLLDGYQSDGQLPIGVSLTRQEAIALGEKLIGDLGADYMQLAHVGRSRRGGGSEEEIQSEAYRNTQCHLLIYTPTVNGIPTIADDTYMIDANLPGREDTERYYERIYIAIDDSGIRNMAWLGHKQMQETVTDNMALFPREQLTAQIAAAMEKEHAHLAETDWELNWQTVDIAITRIELNYVASVTPEGNYLLKPVWDCFGTVDMRLNEDDVAAFNREHGEDAMAIRYFIDRPQHTICTIDAQTGMAFDKTRGTFIEA